MNKKKIIIAAVCLLATTGILIYLYATHKEDIPIRGRHIAYLIDRDTEEVVRTTNTEIDGYISGYNDKKFVGDIALFDFSIGGLPDFQSTENNNYYSLVHRGLDDSLYFGYTYAFVLVKDMNFSTYIIGLSEEFTKNSYKYCFVSNAADENEALKIYKEMKSDIDKCYSLLGTDMDSFTYQGIVKNAEGKEIDRANVTINGLYYLSDEIVHHFYGELLVEGYYESGTCEDTCFITEYTPDVIFSLQNEEGIVAEIYGNPFEGENINIIIKTSEDDKQVTLYEIECTKN